MINLEQAENILENKGFAQMTKSEFDQLISFTARLFGSSNIHNSSERLRFAIKLEKATLVFHQLLLSQENITAETIEHINLQLQQMRDYFHNLGK